MNMNFNIKVKGGPRTTPKVDAYSTAINEKSITFANGASVTDTQIAQWLEEQLLIVLQKLAGVYSLPFTTPSTEPTYSPDEPQNYEDGS